MQEKSKNISVDEILKDDQARKQLMDLLLDQADDECEIKLHGKTYKVSLDVNLTPSF